LGKLCHRRSGPRVFTSTKPNGADHARRRRQYRFTRVHQQALEPSKADLAEETDEGLTRWRKLGGGVLVQAGARSASGSLTRVLPAARHAAERADGPRPRNIG